MKISFSRVKMKFFMHGNLPNFFMAENSMREVVNNPTTFEMSGAKKSCHGRNYHATIFHAWNLSYGPRPQQWSMQGHMHLRIES